MADALPNTVDPNIYLKDTGDFGFDVSQLPKHVAIIMDGNGRWAEERGLSRGQGHRAGVEAVRNILKAAQKLNIKYMTLFSFSSENWSRPKLEIISLFNLLKEFMAKDLSRLHEEGVRIRIIGEESHVPGDILKLLKIATEKTQKNSKFELVLAFNYGARHELVRAAQAIAQEAANGQLNIDDICEKTIQSKLYAGDIPDPDLIIRTSGEQRLSNFLLWQAAYAEFYYDDAYWPDFSESHFHAALKAYIQRDRRFGGLTQPVKG